MAQFGQIGSYKARWESDIGKWRIVLMDNEGGMLPQQEYFGDTREEAEKAAQLGLEASFPMQPVPGYKVCFSGAMYFIDDNA